MTRHAPAAPTGPPGVVALLACTFVGALLLTLSGCGGPSADVVLYVALDRAHSEPIVRLFEERTGLVVDAHYDVEATKSVGLRKRIEEEARNPYCDVFWNNEVVQTVRLAEVGLLQPYVSPEAVDIPAFLKHPDGLWTGFAARGRVLIVNTEQRPTAADGPTGMADFVDPANTGVCGMARPLTGTTAAHAAVLITRDGTDAVLGLFGAMRDNDVSFGPGNAHLMKLVRTGELDFGWTDTDDYKVAEDAGYPVTRVVPDQGEGETGLIVIPNTVGLVTGAKRPDAARQLIDFLLSRTVEQHLAAGPSAQIPVRDDVPRPDHVLDLSRYRLCEVDWIATGRAYDDNREALEQFFIH